MSPGRAPFATVDDILNQARHLLIDFDGPICSLFAGTPTAPIADRLREVIRQQGAHLPQAIENTGNWFEIFSFAASVSADLAARLESELTELECAAVTTAVPTPHVNDVISACRDSARSVAVISNNSEKAVRLPCRTRVGQPDRRDSRPNHLGSSNPQAQPLSDRPGRE